MEKQKNVFAFLHALVKNKIVVLESEVERYAKDMNEDYVHFFCWNAENMYKTQFQLTEYRRLRFVIARENIEELKTYLTNKIESFTNDLLARNIRRFSNIETANIAHSLELESKQQLRQKFEKYLAEINKTA